MYRVSHDPFSHAGPTPTPDQLYAMPDGGGIDVAVEEQVLLRVRFWGGYVQSVYLLFTLASMWFTYWFPLIMAFLAGFTVFVVFTHFSSVHAFAHQRICGWSSFTAVKYVIFCQFVLLLFGFAQLIVGIFITVTSNDFRLVFGIIAAISGLLIVPVAGFTIKACREVEMFVAPTAAAMLGRDPSMPGGFFPGDARSLPRSSSMGAPSPSSSIYVGRGGGPRGGFEGPDEWRDPIPPPVPMERGWERPNPRSSVVEARHQQPALRSALRSGSRVSFAPELGPKRVSMQRGDDNDGGGSGRDGRGSSGSWRRVPPTASAERYIIDDDGDNDYHVAVPTEAETDSFERHGFRVVPRGPRAPTSPPPQEPPRGATLDWNTRGAAARGAAAGLNSPPPVGNTVGTGGGGVPRQIHLPRAASHSRSPATDSGGLQRQGSAVSTASAGHVGGVYVQ